MKKKAFIFVVGLLLGLLAYAGVRFGPDAMALYRAGFFERTEEKVYSPDRVANLKAIHTALMLYHDSEGAFPPADRWMDAISNRLQTADLKPGEGARKLVRPGAKVGTFGYSLNPVVAGQFVEDLPEKAKTVLVSESGDSPRNAVGAPPPTGLAIRVDGTLLEGGAPLSPSGSGH